nr:restriction endonuclease [uncultured Butyrivibrio sp.]
MEDILKIYIEKIIKNTCSIQELLSIIDTMTGEEFEFFCLSLLNRLGFNDVCTTSGSGDRGVDLLAVKNSEKYAIQCKRYSSPLGNKAIQEVYSGRDIYHSDKALVITSSNFTPQAMGDAISLGVELWNRDTLQLKISKIIKEEKERIINQKPPTMPPKSSYQNSSQEKHKAKEKYKNDLDKRTHRYYRRFIDQCIKILEANGWHDISLISSGADYGVDILAEKCCKKYAVQCINYYGLVNKDDLIKLVEGSKYYKSDLMLAITEYEFSDGAKVIAKSNDIELIELKSWPR